MRAHRILVTLLAAGALSAPALIAASPVAQAGATGCDAGVASDFNGDGRADAVVADELGTVATQAEAGRVHVLYGDADGLVGEGSRDILYQGLAGVGGIAEEGDHFGSSVAIADVDCDGYSDLAVGTPEEDINGQSDSGYVQLVFGSPSGLAGGASERIITQSTFSQPIVAGDNLGAAVDAIEDVGQGGTAAPFAFALAVGVPGGDVAGHNDAGWVGFLTAHGANNVALTVNEDSPGMPGTAEAGDRFGSALSLNYLTGDAAIIDCVVGVPNEDSNNKRDAGSATVVTDIYDTPTGVRIDQDSAGVPDKVEKGDQFGRKVDTIKAGGKTWLAIGVPSEDLGKKRKNAGAVQLFTSNGVAPKPGVLLTQDTKKVADTAERGDAFGLKLAWAGPGAGDASIRLAVSAPSEDLGTKANAGMVQVFPMGALGKEATRTQAKPGIEGNAENGDNFGLTLAVIEGATEKVLLVGVPNDATYTLGMVNVIPFAGGTPRVWRPGLSGISTVDVVRFGSALAGVSG